MATDTGKRGRKGGKIAVSIRGFALPEDFPPDFGIPGYGVFFRRTIPVYIKKVADGILALVAEHSFVEIKKVYGFSCPLRQSLDFAGDIKAQLRFTFRHQGGERRRSLPLMAAAGCPVVAACDNIRPVQRIFRKTGLALQMGIMRA